MKTLLLLLLTLCSSLHAEVWTGTSDVRFKGASTLHDFEGSVRAVPLKVTVTASPGGRVISATSDVDVKRMSTDHPDRDKNMWAMFNAAAFRFLKIAVPATPEATLRPKSGAPGTMPVSLTIAGTAGTVTGAVTNLRESPTAVSFDLSFPVSLKAFGLKPPSTLVGLVKVRDTVEVTARVALYRQ
jgi:hypothetical protein